MAGISDGESFSKSISRDGWRPKSKSSRLLSGMLSVSVGITNPELPLYCNPVAWFKAIVLASPPIGSPVCCL